MNILITSAGKRVSLVRAFQKELKHHYPEAKVYTTDMNPSLSPACVVSDGSFTVKRVTDPVYIQELLDLCRSNHISMVVPTIDTELPVLADNKALFAQHNIHVIIASPSFVGKCRDKRQINTFFEERGIRVPAAINKHEPVFPLFIKPYDGSLSVDTFLIRRQEELTDYHMTNEKLLFMEYIDKKDYDEFTVDMYFGRDNKVKCIVPRKRIEIRAGEISKGVTKKNDIVHFLKDKLGYIEGAVGCLTLQLFSAKEKNDIVAIEINARFGGGYPLSYHAGANYPANLISEYFMNQELSYTDSWEDNLLMLRYDDEILVNDYRA